jgi:hypothetical protein
MIPTMAGVILLVFFLFNWIGGDPAYVLAGLFSNQEQIDRMYDDPNFDPKDILTPEGISFDEGAGQGETSETGDFKYNYPEGAYQLPLDVKYADGFADPANDSDDFTDDDKEAFETAYHEGGAGWLFDGEHDWQVEDDYLLIDAPYQISLCEEDGTVIEENVKLKARPDPNTSWPFSPAFPKPIESEGGEID